MHVIVQDDNLEFTITSKQLSVPEKTNQPNYALSRCLAHTECNAAFS